jgi:hypothetical protein
LRPKLLPLDLAKPVIPRAQRVSKSLKTKNLNIKYLKQQQTRARDGGQKSDDIDFSFSIKKIETNYVHPKHKRALLEKRGQILQKDMSYSLRLSNIATEMHRMLIDRR